MKPGKTMAEEPDLSITRKNGIAMITFEATGLRHSLIYALWRTLNQLEGDPETRTVILTGRRNVFLTGADLEEVTELADRRTAAEFLTIPKLLIGRIYHSRKVLIAAINGYCLGGGLELALACDLRIAVDEVKDWEGQSVPYLGFPEANLGIVPPLGGVRLLAETIGLGRAKELLFSARSITGQRAYEIGLVNMLASPDRIVVEAEALASQILRNTALAIGEMKSLLHSNQYSVDFEAALSEATEAFARCCSSHEKDERIAVLRQGQRTRFKATVGEI
jgi:enoyl-CoA hydratase/carnithine racemase